jgi:hypothetical protein
VAGHRDVPGGPDLDLVHRGDEEGLRADQACLGGEGELQVGEAAALAEPRAVRADCDAAHDHQVDRGQLADADPPGRAGRPADRGRLARWLVQVVGIQGEERLRLGQPRNRHVEGLAVFQRPLPHRQLRGVRVGLHGGRLRPGRQLTQPLRGGLRAGEVRDAADRAGEPGDLGRAQRLPHILAQRRLRGQQLGRAAGIAIVARHGTRHPPIVPT